ncbi:hypothetical protein DMR_08850 [Solidesulfovibrio magneticus RS-1]|uniref:Uncharacterized protein n=1 Tax=Solidesulfovibrio magneticus (strain ATCC 700980 / DSM 13731 / RS-1) TaxID=573370 RepID=C4XK21_SOLM1|nr:hypothetical protein DMR_08850 [Solidesulfovibrio magneticus RS-1]
MQIEHFHQQAINAHWSKCSSWIEKNVAVLSVHEFLTGGFPASGFPRDVDLIKVYF